jgi:hypothetical protein
LRKRKEEEVRSGKWGSAHSSSDPTLSGGQGGGENRVIIIQIILRSALRAEKADSKMIAPPKLTVMGYQPHPRHVSLKDVVVWLAYGG